MVRGFFSFAPSFSPCFLKAAICLPVQIRHADNVFTWGQKNRVLICLALEEPEQCDSIVLGVSSRLQ